MSSKNKELNKKCSFYHCELQINHQSLLSLKNYSARSALLNRYNF